MEKISFKSTPKFFYKEKLGIKNNTIRKVTLLEKFTDKRFKILDKAVNDLSIIIEIVNTETGEKFQRETKDVSKYKNFYIITWAYKNEYSF